jgi:hypothetical protein
LLKSTRPNEEYYDETDIAPFRIRAEPIHPSLVVKSLIPASIDNQKMHHNLPVSPISEIKPKPRPLVETDVSITLIESLIGSNKLVSQHHEPLVVDEIPNKQAKLAKGFNDNNKVATHNKPDNMKIAYDDEFASLYSTINKDAKMANDVLTSPTLSISEPLTSHHNTFSTISRLVAAPSNNLQQQCNNPTNVMTKSVDFKENQRPPNTASNVLAKSVVDATNLIEAFTTSEYSNNSSSMGFSKTHTNTYFNEQTSGDEDEDTSEKSNYGKPSSE